jgi:uncharacterized membrane protein
MKLGIYIYGLATIAAGILDLVWREFEPAHQPIQAFGDAIARQHGLAYIGAVWLIFAGAAILWRPTARVGAAASAAIYLLFAIFWLPRFVSATHAFGFNVVVCLGVLGGVAQQAILVAAALIVYEWASGAPSTTTTLARWVFGLSSMNFGIDHFTGARMVAAMVPSWMPFGGNFWAILTGIAFIVAGLAIILCVVDVLAARLLALMLLIFSALTLAPHIFASPHDHVAWGGNAYNLAAVGAVWIFAEWIELRRAERRYTGEQPVLQAS